MSIIPNKIEIENNQPITLDMDPYSNSDGDNNNKKN